MCRATASTTHAADGPPPMTASLSIESARRKGGAARSANSALKPTLNTGHLGVRRDLLGAISAEMGHLGLGSYLDDRGSFGGEG
jgi:hypothetical protein